MSADDSGIRPHDVHFIREDEPDSLPSTVSYLAYSDESGIGELSATAGATIERRRGVGNKRVQDHERGPESHEISVVYDLVKWFTQNNGAAYDAAYDGILRATDNSVANTHRYVQREEKELLAGDTLSGNTARTSREYIVGRGGYVDEITVTGDPSDSQPVTIELAYLFQYLRAFQIDQPTDGESDVLLAVESTESTDTGVQVEFTGVDSSGSDAYESITTDGSDGTTTVSTTTSFQEVDAVYVSEDNVGTIQVSVNAGSQSSPTAGDLLAEVYGKSTYDDVESDNGVPAWDPGSGGSKEDPTTLGSPEKFIGDRITRASNPVPHEVNSASVTIENNVAETERNTAFGMDLSMGEQNIMMEATMFGPSMSMDLLWDHLQTKSRDRTWEMGGGNLELLNTVLQEPGDVAKEEGQAVMTTDNSFDSAGFNVTES